MTQVHDLTLWDEKGPEMVESPTVVSRVVPHTRTPRPLRTETGTSDTLGSAIESERPDLTRASTNSRP